MSAPKWRRGELDDRSGAWWEFVSPHGWEFVVDAGPEFQAWFYPAGDHSGIRVGPVRKTKRASHNDCKRFAKTLRAGLVQFDRAKL